ncbi:MAG: permease-like cell division protein FtsX [Pseudomonadota bacterium]
MSELRSDFRSELRPEVEAQEPAAGRRSADPWPPVRPGLGAWWRDHGRIARETVHFVSARLGTSLLVWLLVGIALALPAGLFLVQQNLAEMTAAWDGRPGITAYFKLDAGTEELDAAVARFEADERVSAVSLTDSTAALAEFQRFTDLADALDVLEANPLPASVKATLVVGTDLETLEALTAEAASFPGVAEVVLEKTWLERVADISAVVSRLGVILAGLFGLGAVLVTATSVRLAIEARLEELRVLKLIGATQRQMRRPFLYFGLFYGLGGGLVAAMLLALCLVVIEAPLSNLIGSYSQELDLVGFDPLFLGGLLFVGGLLGVLGALMAASQRLKDLEIL